MARGIYDSAQNLRIKADVLGAKVSEAYKNGAEFLDLPVMNSPLHLQRLQYIAKLQSLKLAKQYLERLLLP